MAFTPTLRVFLQEEFQIVLPGIEDTDKNLRLPTLYTNKQDDVIKKLKTSFISLSHEKQDGGLRHSTTLLTWGEYTANSLVPTHLLPSGPGSGTTGSEDRKPGTKKPLKQAQE